MGENGRYLRPKDIVPDEDLLYESEGGHQEHMIKGRPLGPPLELEIPFHPPSGRPDRVNIAQIFNYLF